MNNLVSHPVRNSLGMYFLFSYTSFFDKELILGSFEFPLSKKIRSRRKIKKHRICHKRFDGYSASSSFSGFQRQEYVPTLVTVHQLLFVS
jgi:hypothetical protein